MARTPRLGHAALLGLATALAVNDGHAGNEVFIEACDDYPGCNPSYTPLGNSQYDATAFQNMMVYQSLGGFAARTPYFDQNVWSSDIADPESTGLADYDGYWFDKAGNAFSYFSGHGSTVNGNTDHQSYSQFCTADWECAPPYNYLPYPFLFGPNYGGYPSFCERWPTDGFGYCSYSRPHGRALVVSNCTNGPAGRNGELHYGSGDVKWGESTNSGGWAGAGTNGGVNFVGLAISQAELTMRGNEVWAAFAGIHMLANSLTHTFDHLNEPLRGYYFTIPGTYSAYSSVAQSWIDAINSLPAGTFCTNYSGSYSAGGGHGQYGCGGHIVTSIGVDAADAVAHIWEDWYQIQDDSRDSTTSSGYVWQLYSCNYDCNTWPFNMP